MGLFSLFSESNMLYYPGEVCFYRHKDNFEMYKKIFSKLGINFKVIKKQVSSGISAFEAGYEVEARKLARRNFEIFKEENVKEIITNSPEDYKMFLKEYPEMMPDWNIEVKNLWKLILEKLMEKSRLIKFKAMEVVSYQDSCYLGRGCDIYDEPREILELLGYEIREMNDSREESMCCGSCGGLMRTNPELADKIAKERILQAKRIGVKKMIVCSFENYQILKRNISNNEIEILELSDVLGKALGIKSSENKEFNESVAEEETEINLEKEKGEIEEDE